MYNINSLRVKHGGPEQLSQFNGMDDPGSNPRGGETLPTRSELLWSPTQPPVARLPVHFLG